MTALDIITLALQEIGVLNATDPPSAEDAALGLLKLKLLMEEWHVAGIAAYASVALADTITLPDGALPALYLTLAEDLATPMRVELSGKTMQAAGRSRARYFASQRTTPRLETRDHGLPNGTAGQFDYLTGTVS